jgi:integrase/recombinase XerD
MDSRDHTRRRRRIVVAGPLAPFADGLRQDLAGRGYALDTVTDHVHLLADLSGWLASRGLTAADLTGETAGEFLGARRAAGHRTGVSTRALDPVLGYLRSVQAAPPPGLQVPATPLEELLAAYQQYLEDERGLSAGTVTHYLRYARAFLARFPRPVTEALAGLSAGQVTGFVLE